MVGPDGTTFERRDGQPPPDKPGKPGKPGGADNPTGTTSGGAAQQPEGTGKPAPPPEEVNKLFRPEKPGERKPGERGGSGSVSGEQSPGGRTGQGHQGLEGDGDGDPVEKAAARRLKRVIERIEKRRDAAAPGGGDQKGPVTDPNRRRDW
jgi:hypothetical protein